VLKQAKAETQKKPKFKMQNPNQVRHKYLPDAAAADITKAGIKKECKTILGHIRNRFWAVGLPISSANKAMYIVGSPGGE